MRVLIAVCLLQIVLVSSAPSGGNTQNDPEERMNANLRQLGPALFGSPRTEAGNAVSRWTPEMKVNPEELGGYVEGDLLFPEWSARQGKSATSNLAKRWPNGMVPYEISDNYNETDRNKISAAINELHSKTCVRWLPRTDHQDYVHFTKSDTGYWSSVGRIGGRQELNLQNPSVARLGTVIHEMMHALGFFHEQSRSDRDDYVNINYTNIIRGTENNFRKEHATATVDNGVAYDYDSVMHYSDKAFSVNGHPTIVPKTNRKVVIGQRTGLSRSDVQEIRFLYLCDWTPVRNPYN